MFPGWTTPWHDGSGWTASDEFAAREEGWNLLIKDDQITPYSTPASSMPSSDGRVVHPWSPLATAEEFMPKLLEQALSGNRLAYKALYLMAYNDRRWREYIPMVQALKEDYGDNNIRDEGGGQARDG